MEKNSTCFFTGHRDIPDGLYDEIYNNTVKKITDLADKGYTDFICGGAVGFDTLAAKAVLSLRGSLNIKLHLILPCGDQTKFFSDAQKEEYFNIKEACDSVSVLYDKYFRGCMHARNRAMADASSYCIAFCTKKSGGTAYTVNYAESHNVNVYFVN